MSKKPLDILFLAVALTILGYVGLSIKRGKIRSRTIVYTRRKNPINFWMTAALGAAIGLIMVFVLLTDFFSN